MEIGNLVTFNHLPTIDTPGAPSSAQPGVGTVINDKHPDGIMFKGEAWCDVLWPCGEVTKCFKKDLGVIERVK